MPILWQTPTCLLHIPVFIRAPKLPCAQQAAERRRQKSLSLTSSAFPRPTHLFGREHQEHTLKMLPLETSLLLQVLFATRELHTPTWCLHTQQLLTMRSCWPCFKQQTIWVCDTTLESPVRLIRVRRVKAVPFLDTINKTARRYPSIGSKLES